MFKRTTRNQETEEEVMFKCLHCGKDKLKGKRNKETGQLHPSGILRHIKQKTKAGEKQCLAYYDQLRIQAGLNDFDFSSSLMEEFQKSITGPNSNQPPEEQSFANSEMVQSDLSEDSFNNDFGEDESTSNYNHFGQFKDVVLPKSNSLPGKAYFSNKKLKAFKAGPRPTKDNLDSCTYPKKLFPPVAFDTILHHAKVQGLIPKLESKLHQIIGSSLITHPVDSQDPHNLPDVFLEDEFPNAPHTNVSDERDHLSDEDTLEQGSDGINSVVEIQLPIPDQISFPSNPNYLLDRLQQEKNDRTHDPNEQLPPEVIVHLQLLRLQEKHKLSFAAFEDIIAWAKLAHNLEKNIFMDNFPNRNEMLQVYRKMMGLKPDAYMFQETIVQWLPDNKPVIIQRRPFLDCVFELLTKKELLGPNSCNISLPHGTNPYTSQPEIEPHVISELHHGTWWRKTMDKLCTEPGDILCPLAFEVDETFLDKNGRLTVTPFNIKLRIFNNATNKLEEASTTWFYLPNDEAEAAHHENKTYAHHKIHNLHNALRQCMKDLKYLMDNNIGIPWKLVYGGNEYPVNLKFALALVVSDTAMHDKLCCHFGVRNSLVKAICRHCNCQTQHLSSSKHFPRYQNWKPDQLNPDVMGTDEDYWKSISHYPVKNALDELEHGSNKAKTHLNTCGEVLHMHQKGAMERVIESFVYVWKKGKNVAIDNVSMSSKQKNINSSLENLNHLGHQMGGFLNRQSDRNKPRTKFKNSLFTTTKKCAHEQAGVLVCVLLALLSDRGRQICIEERTMADEWIENQVYIIELILMVEIWLKKDEFPREHVMDPPRLAKAIAFYMDRLTAICPREGMGMLLIKNHLMFHLPEYIIRWGPPNGWDSSTLERSHKNQAKRPAKLTQQRPETFLKQLSAIS